MDVIRIEVTGNIARVTERPARITSGTVGLPIEFTFDEQWEGLSKTAVFRGSGTTKIVEDLESETIVPWEVLKKPNTYLHVGVYGTNSDGTVVIATIWANVHGICKGVNPDGDVSTDPTLLVWQKLLNEVGDLTELQTQNKNNLVEAINEVHSIAAAGGVETDPTLTKEGKAADAKATGDAIRNLTAEDVGARSNTWMPTAADVGARPNTWAPTAADVGARPDTWMPTAADVGARPNTWMPSAADVGARPNTWMPSAADVGAAPASHATDKNNPHGVTAAQVGARPDTWMPTAAQVGATPASHATDKNNPHGVTAAQVGAATVFEWATTIPASGWYSIPGSVYQNDVYVAGLLGTDKVDIDVFMPDPNTAYVDHYLTLEEEFSKIYHIPYADGVMSVRARELPTIDIPIKMKVVR